MPPKKKASSKKMHLNLVLPDFARYFFVIAIVSVVILFLWVIAPFFNILIYSGLIAIVFYPLHKLVLKILRGHKGVSALISTFLVSLLILAPLILFTIFIAQEAVDTYTVVEREIEALDLEARDFNGLEDVPWIGETLDDWSREYGFAEFVRENDIELLGMARNAAESVSTFIFDQGASVVKSLGDTVVSLFILVLTVFFFFRDGDQLKEFLKKMSPLPKKYENEIESKLKDTTYGIVVGNFGTALLQGLAGGIGFAIAGIDHAIFWGAIMAFSSLVPYVGAALIWVPAAVFLFFQGEVLWGTFLALWGMLVVATVDNVARPFLIGGSTKMHPLATFLVVLGGVFTFGLKGIIFGPLILSLAVTIIHIYQLEYKEVL